MASETIARKTDEGDAYWFLGGLYEVRLSSEESDGALTLMRMTMPAGMGPPPHTHPGAEIVEVLEGRIAYHIGDEVVEADAGATFHLPAGTLEWFEPQTTTTVLVAYIPGGIEQFFAEVGEPALTRELPPPSDEEPDLERIAEVASRYGMEIRVPE